MKNISERVSTMEARTRPYGLLDSARSITVNHDGMIEQCVVDPPARRAEGLASFYARLERREFATCSDAVDCSDAFRCRATVQQSPET